MGGHTIEVVEEILEFDNVAHPLEGNLTAGKTMRDKMENVVVTSSVTLCMLLLVGHLLRRRFIWLRALHLPSSVVGGLVGWVFFALVGLCGAEELADAWFSLGWEVLPGFCTNLVFACLFLGTPVPRFGVIVQSPRREHLIYGLIVVFGQYFFSALLTGVMMWFDATLPAQFATIVPYGYAGGPVVAEAMKALYAEDSFNYPDGYTLAMLSATVGMLGGVVVGALLVNFAPLSTDAGRMSQGAATVEAAPITPRIAASRQSARARARNAVRRLRKLMRNLKASASLSDHHAPGERPKGAEATVSVESLDSLMFHLCLVACVMMVGYILRLPVVALEETFPRGSFLQKSNLLSVLPLFLFCLLGGLALQRGIDKYGTDARTGKSFVDRETIMSISNTAQDILIVAAISRLGRNGLPPGVHGLGHFVEVIFERGFPFLFLCFAGLVWGVVSFWYIAPLLLPDFWAERALVEFGVSIGATSTGLLLLRMADPEGKTPVLRDFTFKQIFHVLITGGGFFDVLVPIPITSVTGSAWSLFLVSGLVIVLLLAAHPAAGRRLRRALASATQGQAMMRNATTPDMSSIADTPGSVGTSSRAAVTPCASASSASSGAGGGGGVNGLDNGHAPSSGEVSLSAEVTPAAAAKPRAFAESTASTQHAL